uniref:ANK_REP_REGION domain-containing protein n=1 Tax=Macrostomum lignano TaxID=282301 RepID=A0A1I8IZF0_9PLAT
MSIIDELQKAARHGNNEQVKQLIAKGANIHECDTARLTALHRATANGHIAVMTTLIEAGADINSEEDLGRTPIYCACQNGLLPAVNFLIENRADVNRPRKNGRSPLYAAAANGHILVVETLLNAGALVDLPSSTGCSPLYAASQEGHVAVVEHLIGAGADAKRRNNDGSTALHVASWCGRIAVIQSLIDAKVDVDAQDDSGKTPLHEACLAKNVSVIRMLIDAGADVNRQDKKGCTPLFFASSVVCQPAVRILLSNGARPQLASIRPPFSPLQVACFIGSGEIAKAILQHSPEAAERLPASCTSLAKECLEQVPKQALPMGEDIKDELGAKAQSDDVTDSQLSNSLHSQFKKAGFTCQMSAFQSACSDVMQQIEQKRRDWEDIFVVGSFSEGWGNSLSRLIGKTDVESDIDVAEFFPGRMYHLRGRCRCESVKEEDLVTYDNGHVTVTGLTQPEYGSCLRPAFDFVTAYRCCSYPHVEVVENPNPDSHLSDSLLKSLTQCVRESNCHLVTAAPPGQGGQLLRVSTTFLERLTLRSLSDVQGQLFILLKYLIKKVLSETVNGLKTYHAKSLLFYMLEETAPEDWQPGSLVALTRQALQLLLRNIKSSGKRNSECMPHFFMRDAIVYFKSGH